jgi:hypothetical protein
MNIVDWTNPALKMEDNLNTLLMFILLSSKDREYFIAILE